MAIFMTAKLNFLSFICADINSASKQIYFKLCKYVKQFKKKIQVIESRVIFPMLWISYLVSFLEDNLWNSQTKKNPPN